MNNTATEPTSDNNTQPYLPTYPRRTEQKTGTQNMTHRTPCEQDAGSKPVGLYEILTPADVARLSAAPQSAILDEIAALAYPAATYGQWLDAIGLPDLAARARTQLAESTCAGTHMVDLLADGIKPWHSPA